MFRLFQNDIHLIINGGRDNIVTDNVMYNATTYSIVANKRNGNTREHQGFLNYLHVSNTNKHFLSGHIEQKCQYVCTQELAVDNTGFTPSIKTKKNLI